jgi:hypothetical protein
MKSEPGLDAERSFDDEEVRIRIAFERALPARALAAILNSLESAFDDSMRQAVETGLVFPFSVEQIAVAKNIVDLKRGNWLKIHSFKRGSIELVGSVALGWVAGRLLEATLVKSAERAYDGSSLDRTITAVLKANLPNIRALFRNKAIAGLRALESIAVRGIDQAVGPGAVNAAIDGRMYFHVDVEETDPLERVAHRAPTRKATNRTRKRR